MKSSSIKTKFFLIFVIILLISEISLYILSNLFLDDVVISANRILIKQIYNDNKDYFQLNNIDNDKMRSISSKNDIGIIIYDNGNIVSCNTLYLCDTTNPQLPDYIKNYFSYAEENQYTSQIIKLKLINVNDLFTIYNLGNGKYVIFDKSLQSIEEINSIINHFLLISGISIFILGSFLIFMIGNKITRPIIKISKYAKDIADLKLDQKLSIKNQDEIGQLASDMNLISERLNSALKELHSKNKVLQEDLEKEIDLDRKRVKFFSTVSHEFKTPLTIIQGYAEGIKHHVVNSQEDIDEYCEIIIEEAQKMGRFVNDLLNLSLYESGNFVLNKTKFDLVELINFIATKFNDSIRNKKVNFQISGLKSSIIQADKYRMEQVVYNLISNAMKYVEENGVIRITIEDKQKYVKVMFYNNGEHINPKDLNNIWNLFYKLENQKNHIGTGIGLSIVKSIIELHHGKYGVQNKEKGVEFYIEIPKK